MLWPLLLNPWAQRLAGLAAVLALVFGVYLYGKSVARDEAREQALREYAETLERINDDPGIDADDPDAVLRELCRIGNLRDCPL